MRLAVFGMEAYYPSGGWSDLIEVRECNSPQDLKIRCQHFYKNRFAYWYYTDSNSRQQKYDYLQVIDLDTCKAINIESCNVTHEYEQNA